MIIANSVLRAGTDEIGSPDGQPRRMALEGIAVFASSVPIDSASATDSVNGSTSEIDLVGTTASEVDLIAVDDSTSDGQSDEDCEHNKFHLNNIIMIRQIANLYGL